MMITADKRLIVALDVNSLDKMKQLVNDLGASVNFYKVGMELFYSAGEQTVEFLRSADKEVFLDLKLHDIPNTVACSVAALTRLGASIISLHAAGGRSMLAAAARAAAEAATVNGVPRPKLVAITALTSLDEAEWQEIGGQLPISEQVVKLACLAQSAGIDGVVASPQEAPLIRKMCGSEFLVVTPGIRPQASATNDQKRIATPADAIQAGASQLVVGRPITAAASPVQAVEEIVKEIRGES
ncbi:orotidine-5'-phosphate decarboxylase [Anaerospora sp.]|jgi:orotidine-5'-phosphate decarboxylase|uniref:orotidine-5'-phosphate decarboxylase n=1 Tax=Anaerospora sp. TaxID=1960278 RepID=UPI00289FEFB6|nr:orotidine-5'-phosphate decarboxylase [Anaerospora sp.]